MRYTPGPVGIAARTSGPSWRSKRRATDVDADPISHGRREKRASGRGGWGGHADARPRARAAVEDPADAPLAIEDRRARVARVRRAVAQPPDAGGVVAEERAGLVGGAHAAEARPERVLRAID